VTENHGSDNLVKSLTGQTVDRDNRHYSKNNLIAQPFNHFSQNETAGLPKVTSSGHIFEQFGCFVLATQIGTASI
jgi:hypothetical protein